MTLTKRVQALEDAFSKMQTNITWQTRIGYYLASVVTALTFKILFLGL